MDEVFESLIKKENKDFYKQKLKLIKIFK